MLHTNGTRSKGQSTKLRRTTPEQWRVLIALGLGLLVGVMLACIGIYAEGEYVKPIVLAALVGWIVVTVTLIVIVVIFDWNIPAESRFILGVLALDMGLVGVLLGFVSYLCTWGLIFGGVS